MPPWIDELRSGLRQGVVIAAAVLVVALPTIELAKHARSPGPPAPLAAALGHPTGEAPAPPARVRQLDMGGVAAPAGVQRVARWAVDSGDHGSSPFALIDKRAARLYVFDSGGRLAGTSPVLLGYAAGDHSVPGIGMRPIEAVRPHERTTPAGRFIAEPGRNSLHEDVIWVDYEAAVSLHRVRATNPAERRLERLASASARGRRISYGCINVPVEFFDSVVWPLLGARRSVFYVLPEQLPLLTVFPDAAPVAAAVAPLT